MHDNEQGLYLYRVFITKLKARMDCNRLARQSFGMLKICKNCVLFYLRLWKKKEERKRKMNKIEIFMFGFSNLLKVSGTFGEY